MLIDVAIVADNVEPGDRRGPHDADFQGRLAGKRKLLAHQVVGALDHQPDVVGGRKAAAGAEGLDDRLAAGLLDQHDGIAGVRADVVAGALEAQPITLGQGVPDEALGMNGLISGAVAAACRAA